MKFKTSSELVSRKVWHTIYESPSSLWFLICEAPKKITKLLWAKIFRKVGKGFVAPEELDRKKRRGKQSLIG